MKKAIFLLLLISFGAAFIACSRDKNGDNESAERTYSFRNVRWGHESIGSPGIGKAHTHYEEAGFDIVRG